MKSAEGERTKQIVITLSLSERKGLRLSLSLPVKKKERKKRDNSSCLASVFTVTSGSGEKRRISYALPRAGNK